MTEAALRLLEKIRGDFLAAVDEDPTLRALREKIDAGEGSYADAGEYADKLGGKLSDAFMENLGQGWEKGYKNHAESVLRAALAEDHSLISEKAVAVQETMNREAGLGLKAVPAPLNEERANGLAERVCKEDDTEALRNILNAGVRNFSQSVVDDTLKRNVEAQGRAGLRPRLIRKASGGCCPWCAALAGEYDYPDVPDDVYRRHLRCRCTVEYDPGYGRRRQDVWTKSWTSPEEDAKIEARKTYGLEDSQKKKRKRKGTSQEIAREDRQQEMLDYEKIKARQGLQCEEAVLYDADFFQVLKKCGDSTHIRFEEEEINKMKGGILTHNHPDNSCFSPNDINMLQYGELSEIRASISRGVYRMRAPKDWSDEISDLAKIEEKYYEIDNIVSGELYDKARKGEMTFREAERKGQIETTKEFCKRYGIDFSFESFF